MSRVLEEITETDITPQHVAARVDDWTRRIDDLYAQIREWLPEGYSIRLSRNVSMNEAMMREFATPARELPVLEIRLGEMEIARIEPRALWILGANGRLDLFVGERHYLILDSAENFQKPEWKISLFSDRANETPLARDRLRAVLSA